MVRQKKDAHNTLVLHLENTFKERWLDYFVEKTKQLGGKYTKEEVGGYLVYAQESVNSVKGSPIGGLMKEIISHLKFQATRMK